MSETTAKAEQKSTTKKSAAASKKSGTATKKKTAAGSKSSSGARKSAATKRARTKNVETRQFQAETKQLLNLMIHSLYTHKEIFLRELISNSSDALDKIRFNSLTDDSLLKDEESLEIWLSIDKEGKTLSISDNGVGMSKQEVIDNIGTIAQSGSRAFLRAFEASQNAAGQGDMDLIGQFGVGFYSSFMVSDRVELVTRSQQDEMGVRWESAGEGEYTIEDVKVPKRGTTVTLHIREDLLDPDNPQEDYLNQYTIQNMVRKYSDFITYPIKMGFEKEDYEKDEEGKEKKKAKKEIEIRTMNSMKPLWQRDKKEIKEDEYIQFLKHHFHDWNDPADIIHVKVEGAVQYTAMLFVPGQAPVNLYAADYKKGLQLYSKHVFVMDRCESLLPDHFRFVKGLVDSPDFSLNISREILQHDRQIKLIAKNMEKKVSDALKAMLKNDRSKYEKWWEEFGKAIKGGIYMHYTNKEKLQDLLIFHSSHSGSGMTTLAEYVERMPEWQKEIYYEVGKDKESIERLPQMEVIREKNVEVLYFVDKVDEFLTQNLYDYNDKKLQSVSRGELNLPDDKKDKDKKDDTKDKKDDQQEKEEEFKPMLEAIKEHLGEKVKEVRISKRLKSSAVCLVSSDSGPSLNMEMLLKEANQPMGKAQRILELNPDHPTFKVLDREFKKDKNSQQLKDYSDLLFNQAQLIEGLSLDDPVNFAKKINDLMVAAAELK